MMMVVVVMMLIMRIMLVLGQVWDRCGTGVGQVWGDDERRRGGGVCEMGGRSGCGFLPPPNVDAEADVCNM